MTAIIAALSRGDPHVGKFVHLQNLFKSALIMVGRDNGEGGRNVQSVSFLTDQENHFTRRDSQINVRRSIEPQAISKLCLYCPLADPFFDFDAPPGWTKLSVSDRIFIDLKSDTYHSRFILAVHVQQVPGQRSRTRSFLTFFLKTEACNQLYQ